MALFFSLLLIIMSRKAAPRKLVGQSVSPLLGAFLRSGEADRPNPLLLKSLIALDAIHRGQGTKSLLTLLAQHLLVSEELCLLGYEHPHLELVRAALATLVSLDWDADAHRDWKASAPEYQALRTAIEVYDVQLRRAPPAQVREAQLATARRLLDHLDSHDRRAQTTDLQPIIEMETPHRIVCLRKDSEAPELVSALLHAFSTGDSVLGVYDEKDYLRYANQSFLDAFGLEAGQVATFFDIVVGAAKAGRTVRIESNDPVAFVADAQSRRRGRVLEARQRAFPVDFVNDQWFWCTETLLPNGWIVLTGADITSLKHNERALSAQRDDALRLSGIDELTGVPNRRSILARLDAFLLDRATESGAASVALVDLDHFKSINDTFGHETGDIALRNFAQHCAASLPSHYLFGRLGGEEFLLVCPETGVETAKATLERLIGTIPPVSSRIPAHVTISLSFSAGVAEVGTGELRDDLLSRSDRALYHAKSSGRSRVEIDRSSTSSR